MLTERLKTRLTKNRPVTSITLRIPADVVESMREIAPLRGLTGYQTLLKSYISEGLRRDQAHLTSGSAARLIDALKKHGVPESVFAAAVREAA